VVRIGLESIGETQGVPGSSWVQAELLPLCWVLRLEMCCSVSGCSWQPPSRSSWSWSSANFSGCAESGDRVARRTTRCVERAILLGRL
jgi:hypothetical protein